MGAVHPLWAIVQNFPIYPALGVLTYFVLNSVYKSVTNSYKGPLAEFPGPRIAALTGWYKAWIEVYQKKSWTTHLRELHKVYGHVVRVGPNELHFDRPDAYNDIYNHANRWDKDATLYQSFGMDLSSFGFLKYAQAEQRHDILQPLFSRKAVTNLQSLVQNNVDRLCEVLKANDVAGKSSDLFLGLRCYTMDTILQYCFNQSVDALGAPEFQAPIIEAMEASLPAFIFFKHFALIRDIVYSLPPRLSAIVSPAAAGLIRLQAILGKQVREVTENPEILKDSPHEIIYHRLLDKVASKGAPTPSAESLCGEAQALVFGGGDTTGNTLMVGTFHVLANKEIRERLRKELRAGWRDLKRTPTFEELERLPYLTAVIKESLRISPGVPAPLLRVTPFGGAVIGGVKVPSRVTVGMSSTFIHGSGAIFKDPRTFNPERWLADDSATLEKWLVPFSAGPRSCMGPNLVYCELYLGFAALFRRFEMSLDGTTEGDLAWRECFLPSFQGRHLRCFCKPVDR